MFDGFRKALDRWLSLSMRDFVRQVPRIVAGLAIVLLPLWITGTATSTVCLPPSVGQSAPRFQYYWPFWLLLASNAIVWIYRAVAMSGLDEQLRKRRFLASATAGSIRQLQSLLEKCPDLDELGAIRTGILSTAVDKAKEILGENSDDRLSANLMIANEKDRELRLVVFSRHAGGRTKISLSFDAPGAGQAITTGKVTYIADTKKHGHPFKEEDPYRSILSLPISCDHAKIGVVNLDSTEVDHVKPDLLKDHLAPYAQLLGLTVCMERCGSIVGSNHA